MVRILISYEDMLDLAIKLKRHYEDKRDWAYNMMKLKVEHWDPEDAETIFEDIDTLLDGCTKVKILTEEVERLQHEADREINLKNVMFKNDQSREEL